MNTYTKLKESIKVLIMIIVGCFLLYAVISFGVWLFTDPFNWIVDNPKQTYERPIDTAKEACFKKGGIPIPSVWTGQLKRCDGLDY